MFSRLTADELAETPPRQPTLGARQGRVGSVAWGRIPAYGRMAEKSRPPPRFVLNVEWCAACKRQAARHLSNSSPEYDRPIFLSFHVRYLIWTSGF